jgi:hypothetical protein
MNIHLEQFNEIATDQNDAQVELYQQLDNNDLVKLIAGTNIPFEFISDFMRLDWYEQIPGGQENFRPKSAWLSKMKDAQLLAPFYVYLKRLTHT